jgi:HEAT repeat protein
VKKQAWRAGLMTILAFLFLGPGGWPAVADPAKDLKAKDVTVRLAAVEAIRKGAPADAEKLLLSVLGDRDWEVVERASAALGQHGGRASTGPLLKLTLTGPVRRVRLTAARSLLLLDAPSAAKAMLKRMSGKMAEAASEAFGILAPALDDATVVQAFRRGLSSKEPPVRTLAARLVGHLEGAERRAALERVLSMPETSVRSAVLDAVRASPRTVDIRLVKPLLHKESTNDILARRAIAAIVAIVGAAGEDADKTGARALGASELAPGPKSASRIVRLAGLLAAAPRKSEAAGPKRERLLAPKRTIPTLDFALGHEDETVRSAGVHALALIATDEMLDRASRIARGDKSARVRWTALRGLVRARGAKHEGTQALLVSAMGDDADAKVREEAAVALGVKEIGAPVSALTRAMGDDAWTVAVCAAVSLGKTRDERAVEPLRKLLSERDWKLRGAAVVAMGHLHRGEVMPDIIEALTDREPAVARTAWETLKRLTAKTIAPKVKAWRAWWKENGLGFVPVDRANAAREAKKYGYAPTYAGVYEDLDVIVLQSRGDHIEQLLQRLSIAHRLTRQGQVRDGALHPYAVFVANCTGEIAPKDEEPLQWFVRTGGYLFSSCWSLHETVEPVYPGAVRKLQTSGQVLENVVAEACPSDSPFLEGVFAGLTRPIYVLYGAHLIEVLDHERVEVLIDSPTCADTWGGGDLACWFEAGHGVILDSANHFDLQGLEKAEGLKSAEDRMAYAMDHMGLEYEEVRKLAAKRVWDRRARAATEARDLSAFRFITNFVRFKRKP